MARSSSAFHSIQLNRQLDLADLRASRQARGGGQVARAGGPLGPHQLLQRLRDRAIPRGDVGRRDTLREL